MRSAISTRSVPFLAAAAAVLSLVAGCTSGAATASPTSTGGNQAVGGEAPGVPTSENAQCKSPGSKGIAFYSLGGPCGISGPTATGSVTINANVQVDPQRQLSLALVGTNAQLYGSYDSCSCAPDPTAMQGSQTYASYQPCDPSADSGESSTQACSSGFQNIVAASLNAMTDGNITVQLMADSEVLETFTFEVATPASIDVEATSGAAGSPSIRPDASGVYQLHVADQSVSLATHLLTADGRTLVLGGGSAGVSATISDSRVLARDPKATGLGIELRGAGDATVTLSDGAKLTRVLKFHVAS